MPSMYEAVILRSKNRVIDHRIYDISCFSSFAKAMYKHFKFKSGLHRFNFRLRNLEDPRYSDISENDIIISFSETEKYLKIVALNETYDAFITALQHKNDARHSYVLPSRKRQRINLNGDSMATQLAESKAPVSSQQILTELASAKLGKRKPNPNIEIPLPSPAAVAVAALAPSPPKMLSLADYSLWNSGVYSMVPFIERRSLGAVGPAEIPSLSTPVIIAAAKSR